MRLGMAGGLTSHLISGLVGTFLGTQHVFPYVLDALLGMEFPVGVGNLLSKVTLELGTDGLI